MKSILRLFPVILLICVFSLVVSVNANASEVIDSGYCGGEDDGENLTWTLTDDGTLTISGEGEMKDYKDDRKYPWYSHRDNVQHLIIEKGVTTIEYDSFSCLELMTDVTIADSVKVIERRAFCGCDSLSSITIPGSVASIEGMAFLGCKSLKTVILLPGVTTIEYDAFRSCTSLRSIVIPNSVISIGEQAFYYTRLSAAIIPSSVISIGEDAFYASSLQYFSVDEENTVYSDVDGVLFNKDQSTLLDYPDGKVEDTYTIPDTVTAIAENAFTNCYGISNIVVPRNVTSIGTTAFHYAFLYAVTVDAENQCFSDKNGVLFNKDGSTILYYPSKRTHANYSLPSSVTSIAPHAFSFSQYLISITLPESITTIGSHAFAECTNLSCINIPKEVSYIGESAFDNCEKLSSIHLPYKLTKIEQYTFHGCKSLLTVTIPKGVVTIGDDAFCGCSSLTHVVIPNTVAHIGACAFIGTAIKTLELPESLLTIDRSAFSHCRSLVAAKIPNSVSFMGSQVFAHCDALSSVIFTGNAPEFPYGMLGDVTTTAYYPADNETWTNDKLQDYDGNITWVPYTADMLYHTHFSLNTLSQDEFDLTITITSLYGKADDIAVIATYSVDGQMLELCTKVLTSDTAQTFTLARDNTNGEISCVTVFIVDDFSNPVPLVIPQSICTQN